MAPQAQRKLTLLTWSPFQFIASLFACIAYVEGTDIESHLFHFDAPIGGPTTEQSPCPDNAWNETPVVIAGIVDKFSTDSGDDDVRGARFFFALLNQARGGLCLQGQRRPVQLLMMADGSSATSRQDILNEVVNRDIDYVLGFQGSYAYQDVAAQYQSAGKLMVCSIASSMDVIQHPNIFTTWFSAKAELHNIFAFASAWGLKTVGIMAVNEAYYLSVANAANELAKEIGLEIVSNVTIAQPTSTDQREPLIKAGLSEIQAVGPDLVVNVIPWCKQVVLSMYSLSYTPQMHHCLYLEDTETTEMSDQEEQYLRFTLFNSGWSVDDYTISSENGMFTNFSATPPLTNKEWAANYTREFAAEPGYLSSFAFSAAQVLISGIEAADSLEVSNVREALGNLSTSTVAGKMDFDDVGYGSDFVNIIQYQVEVPMTATLIRGVNDYYPLPTWHDWFCHINVTTSSSIYGLVPFMGYEGDSCVFCSDGVPIWDSSSNRMECEGCTLPYVWDEGTWQCIYCDSGYDWYGICPAGYYNSDTCQCDECAAGSYTDEDGLTACKSCPAGTFADSSVATECTPCGAGMSAEEASSGCILCSRGWFANTSHSATCSLCADGYVSTERGSTVCTRCELGTQSVYGQTSCEECEVGYYGRWKLDHSATYCAEGVAGGYFTTAGQTYAVNRDDYWTSQQFETLGDETFLAFAWERCHGIPGSCLTNYKCITGATGVHCTTCLPGYTSNPFFGQSCFKCPSDGLNMFMTFVVLMAASMAVFFITTATGAMSLRSGLDKRLMLIKFFILHCITVGALYVDIGEVLSTHEPYLDATLRDVIYSLCNMFIAITGVVIPPESAWWSPSCLLQDADTNNLFDYFTQMDQTRWYHHDYTSAKELLKGFHVDTERRVVIFWICAPFAITVSTYVILLLYVTANILINRRKYMEAEDFHVKMIHSPGEVADVEPAKMLQYAAVSRCRILNMWLPRWFVSHRGFRGLWKSFKSFNKGVRPMFLATFLLCYSGVLMHFSRLVTCRPVGSASLIRSTSILGCTESFASKNFARACYYAWGIGAPCLVYIYANLIILTGGTVKSHDPFSLSVWVLGYRRHSQNWDFKAFVLKFMVMWMLTIEDFSDRMSGQILCLTTFVVIHQAVKPYQSLWTGPMPTMAVTQLMILLLTAFLFGTACGREVMEMFGGVADETVQDDLQAEWEEEHLGKFQPSHLVILFFISVGVNWLLLFIIARRVFVGTVEAVLWGSFKDKPPGAERGKFERLLLWFRNRELSAKPYVCFEPMLGALSVLQSRADLGEAIRGVDSSFFVTLLSHHDREEDGDGAESAAVSPFCEFSLDETREPEANERNLRARWNEAHHFQVGASAKVRPGRRSQRRLVEESLCHTLRHLATLPGSSTVSISMFEFVIRAAFSVSREIEEQEHVVHKSSHLAVTGVSKNSAQMPMDRIETWGRLVGTDLIEKTRGRATAGGLLKMTSEATISTLSHKELKMARTVSGAWSPKASMPMHKASAFWREFVSCLRFWSCCWRGRRTHHSPQHHYVPPAMPSSAGARFDASSPSEAKPTKTLLDQQVEDRLHQMFDDSTFEWGVELSLFREALSRIEQLPDPELRLMLDSFESWWNRYNAIALWGVDSATQRVRVNNSWVRESEYGFPEDPEENDGKGGALLSQQSSSSDSGFGVRSRYTRT